VRLLHTRIFFVRKNKISIFGGISKFLKLIIFGQILTKFDSFRQFWAVLGKFSCYGSGSMPLFEKKLRKRHNFYKTCQNLLYVMACWKAIWIFHSPKKFQKIQLQIRIVVACPKSQNSIYGTHNPLGIILQQDDFKILRLLS
jgi:hypothetical protein